MAAWFRLGVIGAVLAVGLAGCGDHRLSDSGGALDGGATISPAQRDAGATASPPNASQGTADAGNPAQADAADATWPPAQTHRLTADSVEAVQLATNGSAVFGMTANSGIWSLAAGDTAVRVLVAPGNTVAPSAWGSRLIASGSDLYWLDRVAGALHRTRADGSADDVLAGGLVGPDTLAADDARVYWSELGHLGGQGGGVVRSLPRDAAPGDPPATLVSVGPMNAISSLVAFGGTLYWTSFISIGATVYYAGLFASSPDALLQGGAGTPLEGSNPYRLTATGGDVFYGVHHDLWTTDLMDLPSLSAPARLLSILPVDVTLAGLAATDQWLIAAGQSSVGTELYIAPRSGAGLVRIAQGLRTPPIVGPAGITFIDESGALVFVDVNDLGYIGFGHPAPAGASPQGG